MLSDGRFLEAQLNKEHCRDCRLVRHVSPPSKDQLEAIFKEGYELYAHPAGDSFEMQRQRRYADWILALIGARPVETVFEIGAGNGSFLTELHRRMPDWRLKGLEPSPIAAGHARESGFDIQTGLLQDIDVSGADADIVLAINVVEHAHDPTAFLSHAVTAVADNGCLIVVCPDGERPSSELLVYDHLHSFTALAIDNIARKAGLTITQRVIAPVSLGPFQALLLRRSSEADESARIGAPAQGLYEWRYRFLLAWHQLDSALVQRIESAGGNVWAFGGGESAQMLRTYAPETWSRVAGVLSDVPGSFDRQPVRIYGPSTDGQPRTLLLAVRPEIQGAVANRLTHDGNKVVQWDDLILGG
ncbi:class I SAM-dependent methyltransferase [Parvibaculum lavamentivorans]|nr:class I SAM-dependent methyltransferase [Parvibaculum lavamentivorans]